MKKLITCFTILMTLAVMTSAIAEVKEGAFSITPYVGGYLFEGNQDLKHSPVYGLRGGYNFTQSLGLEGYINYVQSEYESLAGNPDMDVFGYGIDGLYHFLPENRLVPFVALGLGNTHYDPAGMDNHDKFTLSYGAGLKYFLTDNMALRADVRHVMPFNDHYNDLLYTFGLTFAFGGPTEKVETQVSEPAAAVTVEVARDTDGDGVLDDRDACPNTPSGVKVDTDGCPLDSDKDGVYDYMDKCPNTPSGVKVDADGRPLDTDKDGVYDYLDKCPGTPIGVAVDKNGCPFQPVEKEIIEKGRVTLNVQFDFDKDVVKPEYREEIGQLAGVLKKYPDLTITIEGHTDSVGEATYNKSLSQRRADAVKRYLVEEFGIDAKRLIAKGYGETQPVASNANKEGRQKNRRVDAVAEYQYIIKQ